MRSFIVIGFVLLLGQSGKAQQDSIAKRHFFSKKQFIVPAALIGYGVIAARTDVGLDWDEWMKRQIWDIHPHAHTKLDNYLQFAPGVMAYGLDWAGVKAAHDFVDRSVIYVMANLIMAGSVFAVKNISHEQRPDGSDYYSFPSGHTAEAFVSAELLYQEYRDVSPWIGIGGYGVAGTVAYLRIFNNKHWFRNVVAGAGFGIASTRLAYLIFPLVKKLYRSKRPLRTAVLPFQQQGARGLTLVRSF